MSHRQQPGSAGTPEYLYYQGPRAGAQVEYNYAAESSRQNTQAQREPPPAQSSQFNGRQSQNTAPRPPRPLRGIAEYHTEIQRAVSRARDFGFNRDVFTGVEMPFLHLGQSRSAIDLMGTLEAYARQAYSSRSVEFSYVEGFLRQLDQVKYLIGVSWIGAGLCADQPPSDDWDEFLNLFTGFLQGANDLYDGVQTLITRCERAMYDRRGELRDDANRRFMRAFNHGHERADLTGDMRDWVSSVSDLDGDPSSLLSQARDLRRHYEMERQRRQGY